MKTSEAKALIVNELSAMTGFKVVFRKEFNYLALGVRIGRITVKDAASSVLDGVSVTIQN